MTLNIRRPASSSPAHAPVPTAPEVPAANNAAPAAKTSAAPQDTVEKTATLRGPPAPAVDAAAVRVANLGRALVDVAGGTSGNAASTTDNAVGKLGVGSTLMNTPSGMGKPAPGKASGVSHTVLPHGVSLDLNRVTGAGDAAVDAGLSATIMRGNLALDGSRTVLGQRVTGGVSMENGYADMSSGLRWATKDGGVANVGTFVGVTAGSVFVGGSAKSTNAQGETNAVSAFGRLNASRTISDLGDADGSIPALAGKRAIELRTSAGGGGVLAPGRLAGSVGVGVRLTVDKNKSLVFRTHVEPERARELLFEHKGVTGFFRDKGRALGLVEEPLKLPNLAEPSQLKTGDQLVVSVTGSVMGGVALGALGIRAGVSAVAAGDFEVAVRKLDETHVQLVVTPTEVRGLEVFLDSPLLLEVRATRSQAASLRQAFTFDLSKPAAQQAYLQALQGKLPGALDKAAKDHPEATQLADLVRHEQLPAGITRECVEQCTLDRNNVSAGLGFGIIEAGSLAGLSLARSSTQSTSSITNGSVLVDTRARGVENRREVLLSGTETSGISASARSVTSFAANGAATQVFDSLTLSARFSDDRVRGMELNDEVVDHINQAMGLALPHFSRAGHKESRTVSLERVLTQADLQRLASLDTAGFQKALGNADISQTAVQEFQKDLSGTKDTSGQAALVQRFIASHGLAGLAVIHRALGGPADSLMVATQSNAYSKPVTTASTLQLRYPAPVSGKDAPAVVVERFHNVQSLLKDVDVALLDAKEDPLLDAPAKTSITSALAAARTTALGLFSLVGLDAQQRAALKTALESGWTTSDEAAVVNLLDALPA